ncbi:MAG: hypothetical protein ACE5IK_00845, partial [Acidobacteriota bacterium]
MLDDTPVVADKMPTSPRRHPASRRTQSGQAGSDSNESLYEYTTKVKRRREVFAILGGCAFFHHLPVPAAITVEFRHIRLGRTVTDALFDNFHHDVSTQSICDLLVE